MHHPHFKNEKSGARIVRNLPMVMWPNQALVSARRAMPQGLLLRGTCFLLYKCPESGSISVCLSVCLSLSCPRYVSYSLPLSLFLSLPNSYLLVRVSSPPPTYPTNATWLKLKPLSWPLLQTSPSWAPTISQAFVSSQLAAASPSRYPAVFAAQALQFLAQSRAFLTLTSTRLPGGLVKILVLAQCLGGPEMLHC